MTVTLVALSARGEGEVAVTFELSEGENRQRESFLISSALVADLCLCVGESSRECFDTVAEEAERYKAIKKALSLLGYGARSCRDLCRRLTEKGISRPVAEEAVKRLQREGYLNENRDAYREAERCVTKLWGRRRIVATLRQKGYGDECVREALNRLVNEGVDFSALCVQRLRQGCGVVPSTPEEKRKLVASLERYGFTLDEIREGLRALVAEGNDQ